MISRIREISVVIQQVRQTLGNSLSILNGSINNSTTERGSLNYNFDFGELSRAIRASVLEYAPEEVLTEEGEVRDMKDSIRELIKSYVAVDKLIKDNLRNMTVPLKDSSVMKNAAQQLYNDSKKENLTFDEVDAIITASAKNKNPFGDGSGIVNGNFSMGYTCPSVGDDKCTKTDPGDPLEVFQQFLTNQIKCIGEAFTNTVLAALLKPYVKLGNFLHNEDPFYPAAIGLYLRGISFVLAFTPVMPYLALPLFAFLASPTLKPIFTWVTKFYCQFCKKSGDTNGDIYQNVCINNPDFDAQILEVTYNGDTRYYDANSAKFSGSEVTIKWRTDSGVSEITTEDYTIERTYSIFEYEPVYYSEPDIDETYSGEDLNQIAEDAENGEGLGTGEIAKDQDGTPFLIPLTEDGKVPLCSAQTETLSALLNLKFIDMIIHPEKYGLSDPADVVAYVRIKSDFPLISALGDLARYSSLDDSFINDMEQLCDTYNQKYEDYMSNIKIQAISQGNDPEKYIEAFGAVDVDYGPIVAIGADSMKILYDSLYAILKKDQLIETACCLLGELIEDAIGKIEKEELGLNVDNIVKKMNTFIDYFIAMLELGKKVMLPDISKLLEKMLQGATGFVTNLAGMAMIQLYGNLKDVLKVNIGTDDVSYVRCLPMDILNNMVNKFINMALGRFLQFFNMIIGQIDTAISDLDIEIDRIALLSAVSEMQMILGNLKITPNILSTCLEMNEQFEGNIDELVQEQAEYADPEFEAEENSGKTPESHGSDGSAYDQYRDKMILYRASKQVGYPIFLNKKKLKYIIENAINGDPVAISKYLNQKRKLEKFEDRQHSNDRINTIKNILDYYKVR